MLEMPTLQQGAGLSFRELPPRAPAAQGPSPVLVLLHGVGSNEQDLMGLAPRVDPRARIISVRGPLTIGPEAYAWFSVQFTPTGPVIVPEQEAASRAAIADFIDWVAQRQGIPASLVFLLGFSQGGIMTLNEALTQPRHFGGGLAYNIRLLPEVLKQLAPAEELSGAPMFVAQTRQDPVMRLSWSRDMHEKLTRLPLALSYHEYEGGHQIVEAALSDGMQWLSRQIDLRMAR